MRISGDRHVRDSEVKERILRECEDNPITCAKSIARTTDVSKSTVSKVLHEERLFPYCLERNASTEGS